MTFRQWFKANDAQQRVLRNQFANTTEATTAGEKYDPERLCSDCVHMILVSEQLWDCTQGKWPHAYRGKKPRGTATTPRLEEIAATCTRFVLREKKK